MSITMCTIIMLGLFASGHKAGIMGVGIAMQIVVSHVLHYAELAVCMTDAEVADYIACTYFCACGLAQTWSDRMTSTCPLEIGIHMENMLTDYNLQDMGKS